MSGTDRDPSGKDPVPPAAAKLRGAMELVDRFMAVVVTAALIVSAASVAAIVVIGAWDTLGRLVGAPLPGSVEMTESLLAATIFLAMPFAQRQYRHVVVDILVQSIKGVPRYVLHLLALVFTCGAFLLLFLQSYEGAVHSWAVAEVSSGLLRVPVWLAKLLSCLGLAIATLETLRQIVFALIRPADALPDSDAVLGESGVGRES